MTRIIKNVYLIFFLSCLNIFAQDFNEQSLKELKDIFYGFNDFNDPNLDNTDYILSLIKQTQIVNEKLASLLEENILAYAKLNYDIALYKKSLHNLGYDDTGLNLDKAKTELDSRELYLKYIAIGYVVIAKNENLDFDSYVQEMRKNYTFDTKDLLIFYYLKQTMQGETKFENYAAYLRSKALTSFIQKKLITWPYIKKLHDMYLKKRELYGSIKTLISLIEN